MELTTACKLPNPITVFLTVACLVVGAGLGATGHLYAGIPVVIVAIIIAAALKMANTWQKFVILRAGKLRGVKGPGLFVIIPVLDRVAAVIDERIQTTAFSAEEALTKDTVPVNVDAIICGSARRLPPIGVQGSPSLNRSKS